MEVFHGSQGISLNLRASQVEFLNPDRVHRAGGQAGVAEQTFVLSFEVYVYGSGFREEDIYCARLHTASAAVSCNAEPLVDLNADEKPN